MKAWKDVRACVWAFFFCRCTNNSLSLSPFHVQVSSLSFLKLYTRGSKIQSSSVFPHRRTTADRTTAGCDPFPSKKKIRSCKKQIKVHIHFQTLHIRERQFTPFFLVFSALLSFEQIVHAVRGCDTLKTFHFGWRTFTNGGGGWCGGVTRFAPKQSHRVTDDFAEGAQFNTSCWDLFDPSP